MVVPAMIYPSKGCSPFFSLFTTKSRRSTLLPFCESMMNRLAESRALVVGCNSEVAAAITQAIAEQNVRHVVGTYLPSHETRGVGIDGVRKQVEALTKFTAMPLDQTNVTQIREVLDAAQNIMGGLDIVVTAASRQWDGGDYMEMPDHEFEEQIAVNLIGPMHIMREAARRMMTLHDEGDRRHRAMCAIASVRGTDPLMEHPYDAAKAAIIHFVAGFAKRLGPYGIKIGAIAPGTVDVALEPVRHGCSPAEYRARWQPLTPLGGTPVTPAMVAEETVYLLNSTSMTGETRIVAGGYETMRPLPRRAEQ